MSELPAVKIPITLLHEQAIVPSHAYDGDAGYDLYATEAKTLQPFERALIGTGIAIELPKGKAAFVLPRSGLAIKQGLSLVNAPGLIDSNYRGEIKAIVINLDPQESIEIRPGDRIAQLVVMDVDAIDFTVVEELGNSERGQGGFGSSGISHISSHGNSN